MINQTSFYGPHELDYLRQQFKHIGEDVKISRYAQFYNTQNISIGDHSRIDDFVILSAGDAIEIDRYVHIGAQCFLSGESYIHLYDYSGLSVGCKLFSSSDSYNGLSMTNPCIPKKYRTIERMPIFIEKHGLVGAGSIILPGGCIGLSGILAANSMLKNGIPALHIFGGNPAKFIGIRNPQHREYELKLKNSELDIN